MRSKFIAQFTEAISNFINELPSAWDDLVYTLPRYKGFSYTRFHKMNDGKNFKRGFYNLKQRGLIKDIDSNRFAITQKGIKWLSPSLQRRAFLRPRKWDKKWRVVIFDIPNEYNKERLKFRRMLKFMGFSMVQKSIFVWPHRCHEEIADICQKLNISDYVDIIVAESMGFSENKLKKEFGL